MSETITVNDVTEVVTVTDSPDSLSVTITEEVIQVGSGTDEVNITQVSESVAVSNVTESVNVTTDEISIQPNAGEVIIQPIPEDAMPYARRTDFVGDTLIYKGEATVGTVESAASWRVRRLTIGTDDDVTEEWAAGNASFNKVWDDRASFTYT